METSQMCFGAGRPAPECDEARRQPGFGEQNQEDGRDCAATETDRKALVTMQARAALCGCTLHELVGGEYLISRWNLSKVVSDLRAVGNLLHRIGGPRG